MIDAKVDDLLAQLDRANRRARSRLFIFLAIALALTLLFFGPYFFDIASSVFGKRQSVAEAAFIQEQVAAWRRNASCGTGQSTWHPAVNGSKIDAVICPGTGDILVRKIDRNGALTQRFVSADSLR